MPYIAPELRPKYNKILKQLPDIPTKGELEYCIYWIMNYYMQGSNLNNQKIANYSNYHDTVYAAQHCSDEYRRRHLDKREDFALEKNGDIDVD